MLHVQVWVCTEVRGGYLTITTRYSDVQAAAHLAEELELGGVGMWCGKVGCEVYMLHVQVWVCTEVRGGYLTITTRYSDAQAVAHLTEELELGGVGIWCGKVGCEVYMLHARVWVCTEVRGGYHTITTAQAAAHLAEELDDLLALQVVHPLLASRGEKKLHQEVDTAGESIL